MAKTYNREAKMWRCSNPKCRYNRNFAHWRECIKCLQAKLGKEPRE